MKRRVVLVARISLTASSALLLVLLGSIALGIQPGVSHIQLGRNSTSVNISGIDHLEYFDAAFRSYFVAVCAISHLAISGRTESYVRTTLATILLGLAIFQAFVLVGTFPRTLPLFVLESSSAYEFLTVIPKIVLTLLVGAAVLFLYDVLTKQLTDRSPVR